MPSGRQWVNVLHCRYAGGASTPGTSDITALDLVLTRLYSGTAYSGGAAWLTNCAPATTLIDATYYVLNGLAVPQIIPHAVAATGSGNSLPPEVAHVVTNRTQYRGRSYRGRVYLPAAVIGSMTTGGNLSPTIATATVAQFVGAKAALGGPSVAPFWEIGVASYLHSSFEANASFTMDAKPDVQRRRK